MPEKPQISEELSQALEVAKQRIDVASYYEAAMNKGLKGHAMGYWSGTIMGLTTGSLIGLALTIAFPAVSALTLLGISAAAGAGLGGIVGSRVGISAATVAGVMGEKERREKAKELEAEVLASPQKQQEVLAAYRADPVVKKDDTIQEIFATHDTASAWKKIINPKALALTVIAGAVVGIVLIGLPFEPASASGLLSTLGVTSKWGAAGVGALIGGGVGTTFGIYFPGVLASLAQTVGDILSGKMFDVITNGKTVEAPKMPVFSHKLQPQTSSRLAINIQPDINNINQVSRSEAPMNQVMAHGALAQERLAQLAQQQQDK